VTAPHPFWSRVPDPVLKWLLWRLWAPMVTESSRRMLARMHAAQEPREEGRAPLGHCASDPFAPLAPPSPRLPTQIYGTPPRAGGALGRDPFAQGGEG